eukprot:3284635-Pleurochrysis_carterae.AAC.2
MTKRKKFSEGAQSMIESKEVEKEKKKGTRTDGRSEGKVMAKQHHRKLLESTGKKMKHGLSDAPARSPAQGRMPRLALQHHFEKRGRHPSTPAAENSAPHPQRR